MAFDISNFNCVSRSTTAPKPVFYTYVSTDDAVATIAASGYFNDITDTIDTNDLIYVVGSDGTGLYRFTSASGDATVTVAAFDATPAGSIVNADISASAAIAFSKLAALTSGNILVGNGSNVATSVALSGDATLANTGALTIANAAVSLAKLATAIQPSHVVKYAGQHTTVGGSASEAITVTGVAATDFVFAQVKTQGVTPRTILAAVPSTNTVTITFSGDPSNDHVIYYQVLRATS